MSATKSFLSLMVILVLLFLAWSARHFGIRSRSAQLFKWVPLSVALVLAGFQLFSLVDTFGVSEKQAIGLVVSETSISVPPATRNNAYRGKGSSDGTIRIAVPEGEFTDSIAYSSGGSRLLVRYKVGRYSGRIYPIEIGPKR